MAAFYCMAVNKGLWWSVSADRGGGALRWSCRLPPLGRTPKPPGKPAVRRGSDSLHQPPWALIAEFKEVHPVGMPW